MTPECMCVCTVVYILHIMCTCCSRILLFLTQEYVVDNLLVGGYRQRVLRLCDQSPMDGSAFVLLYKPQGGRPQHSFVQWPQDKDTYSLGVLIWQLTGQQ